MPAANVTPEPLPKRLVLCFDGTGNTFSGNTSDTNIVKLYDKFERNDDNQFHYYQPGIGTYDIDGGSLNKGIFGGLRSKVSRTVDQGLATSFDAHVIAGYRFVMQHYSKGDKIFMFGFSRGAFTARFLARMIATVGLLSRGNDEMVPFAYQLYQDYERGRVKFDDDDSPHGTDRLLSCVDAEEDEMQLKRNKLAAFTNTFCRREPVVDDAGEQIWERGQPLWKGVQVYFLGLFDCVGSVAVLENPFIINPAPVSVVGTAQHVRHAVAVDERRVKFKAALLAQDIKPEKARNAADPQAGKETALEVWFPGNHGDVGGGWPADNKKVTWGEWFRSFWSDPSKATKDVTADPYQMSDVALSWMIDELQRIGDGDPKGRLTWNQRLKGFQSNFQKKKDQALTARKHDTMTVGGGSGFFKVMFWKMLECLPFMPRQELEDGKWVRRMILPNFGDCRDIPRQADLHESLLWRLRQQVNGYRPKNSHGGHTGACLLNENNFVPSLNNHKERPTKDHRLYTFKSEMTGDGQAQSLRNI